MRSPHTAMKSSPRSPQLEKARAQQQRPNTAKNKLKKERNLFKKRRDRYIIKESILNSWLGFNIHNNVLEFASPHFKNPFLSHLNSHDRLWACNLQGYFRLKNTMLSSVRYSNKATKSLILLFSPRKRLFPKV